MSDSFNQIKMTGLHIFILLILTACNQPSKKGEDEILENKAYDARKSGNYRLSISYYTELIEKDSLTGKYFFGRAYASSMLQRDSEATLDYLKAAQLHYKQGSCYYNLGLLNAFVNDSAALVYFQTALKTYPDRGDIKKQYSECIRRIKLKQVIKNE
jgi:tetratricopeptide (TPR) repeat protein